MPESPFLRKHFIKVDDLGIDPLGDSSIEAILSINEYITYIVPQESAGNVQRIAYDQYNGRTDLWWVILVYNGIGSGRQIKMGQEIRLPLYSSIVTALNKAREKQITDTPLAQRTVEI